jgi:two-component system, NtrC family, response regulator AtoC
MSGTVLVVDDEDALCRYLAGLLGDAGYRAVTARTAAEARARMGEVFPDVVLLDLKLPDASGEELLPQLKRACPEAVFIIISAHGSIRAAVQLVRDGAVDFLTKPFEPEQLLVAVKNALDRRILSDQVRELRGSSRAAPGLPQYPSPAMQQIVPLFETAAAQDGTVLLLGESGTGKSVMARWIHDHSRRAAGPFFAINCAALPRELAESELFGHEPGAFTGVRGRKRGLLELAEEGTLLLDEVGDMELGLQAKLLTFFDTRTFLRVGAEKATRVDARILVASNRSLAAAVEARTFRADLYYRLAAFPIEMPPLRSRLADLPLLADETVSRLVRDLGVARRPIISRPAIQALSAYSWPGNLRELRNVFERALMLLHGDVIGPEHLSLSVKPSTWSVTFHFPSGETLEEMTDALVRSVLDEALRRSGSQAQAAKLLGLSRHAFGRHARRLGVGGGRRTG